MQAPGRGAALDMDQTPVTRMPHVQVAVRLGGATAALCSHVLPNTALVDPWAPGAPSAPPSLTEQGVAASGQAWRGRAVHWPWLYWTLPRPKMVASISTSAAHPAPHPSPAACC